MTRVSRTTFTNQRETWMIYITGDTHGELDRFKGKELRGLGKNDILLILGDFGFLWDGSKEEKSRLKWLCKRPYTILFLDGTHENFDLLDPYPVEEKFGGRVQHIGGSVYHVCRGSILELEGQSYLAAHNYKVEYVLTHDAPTRFLDFTALAPGESNRLHAFFDKLVGEITYDHWLFGRYHKDTTLSPKVRCVFNDVIPVGEKRSWWKRR